MTFLSSLYRISSSEQYWEYSARNTTISALQANNLRLNNSKVKFKLCQVDMNFCGNYLPHYYMLYIFFTLSSFSLLPYYKEHHSIFPTAVIDFLFIYFSNQFFQYINILKIYILYIDKIKFRQI